jgi:hypothetical protein
MHMECFGEFVQRAERKILFRSFNRADVRSMKVAFGGKRLLRPSPLLTEAAHDDRYDPD